MESLATSLKTSIETLEGFRGGGGAAFVEIVRAYTPMLRSIVSRYWRGAFQREEAMQEIWSLAYRQRESLDPSRFGEFAAWLATLSRNRCIDLLRKQGREIGPGFEDPARDLESLPANGAQERSVEAADLQAAVEDLHKSFRRSGDPSSTCTSRKGSATKKFQKNSRSAVRAASTSSACWSKERGRARS